MFQDQSLRVQHNLGVFGGCGLVLSIITGLCGINVDGIPGSDRSPYAFALFSCALFLLGAVLIAIGLIYLGLKKPLIEEKAEVRKLELQELVRMFQQEAESHAQCASFALGMVSQPSSQCCNELGRLHGMARTTDDRRQACNCLKQIAPQYPGAMDANLLALPQLCRVALAYPIRRDADCSK
ncbi:UNVERIFIED_CONTAM: Non-specific lipid-transfer protein [Sesamum radiatum]|uniref:Non-specific lipid-transfer protein n=1 Tax=Sesamum radiatum TaxID=300843 RepID=A0AAW2K477_SESRA